MKNALGAINYWILNFSPSSHFLAGAGAAAPREGETNWCFFTVALNLSNDIESFSFFLLLHMDFKIF
jgi:hypothetical protein